jgi:hypothetical protein
MAYQLDMFKERLLRVPFSHLSYGEVCDRVREKGYHYIGGGHFSNVFAKDGSKSVIKVGKNPLKQMDGWVPFAKLAMMHPEIEAFPKIYRLVEARDCYVATMERLEDYPEDMDLQYDYKEEIRRLANYAATRSSYYKSSYYRDLPRHIARPIAKGASLIGRWLVPDWDTDIHNGNILWRGNMPVISDPLSFFKAPKDWRKSCVKPVSSSRSTTMNITF